MNSKQILPTNLLALDSLRFLADQLQHNMARLNIILVIERPANPENPSDQAAAQLLITLQQAILDSQKLIALLTQGATNVPS